MQSLVELGKKIYNMNNPREVRRMVIFVLRGHLYRSTMRELFDFFGQNELLAEVADSYPFVYEQPQRAFFYNKSTMRERLDLLKAHFSLLTDRFTPEAVRGLYREKYFPLWEMDIDGEKLELSLYFEPGQRKEGLLSVMLTFGSRSNHFYQIIFWLAPDKAGEMSMWIGALQGPNTDDSREAIKRVTKACHTFRTKNLILYAAQAVARALDLKHIYAVTNYGYYANNHIRTDRKLKTNFSDFWKEAGGHATSDSRFDELPLTEARKTMEEVPTRKRAVYRRRFALMDEIDGAVAAGMAGLMKERKLSFAAEEKQTGVVPVILSASDKIDFQKCLAEKETIGQLPPSADEAVHFAFGVDDNYVPPMGIMITSLALHNPGRRIVCHIFYKEISRANREKLTELVSTWPQVSLKLYAVDKQLFRHFSTTPLYTEATYYRILAGAILAGRVKKLIYIDADTLCLGDFSSLLTEDFAGKTILAVADQGKGWPEYIRQEKIDSDRYFNAGFLYIDLEKWNEADLSMRMFDLLQTRRFTFLDQDALNVLACHEVKFIDEKYNRFCILTANLSSEDIAKNEKMPAGTIFVHFAGRTKPWHEWCTDLRRQEYLDCQAKSPWRDWQYQIRNYQENKQMAHYLQQKGDITGAACYYLRYAAAKCCYLFHRR